MRNSHFLTFLRRGNLPELDKVTEYLGLGVDRQIIDTLVFFGDAKRYTHQGYLLLVIGHILPEPNEAFMDLLINKPEEALLKPEGLYQIVLYNPREESLLVSGDFFSKRTAYYRVIDDVPFISSHPALLANLGNSNPELDIQGLQHFAGYAYTPPPYTFFKGVREIDFGSYLLYKQNRLMIRRYYRLPNIEPKSTVTKDDSERLRELIKTSVKDVLDAIRIKPSFFSSGGLDTTSVIWAGKQLLEDRLKTYTVGFDLYKDELNIEYDESGYAGIVAKHFDNDAHIIRIDGKTASRLMLPAIHAMAKPSGDALNTYFVLNGIDRGDLHVLSGTGGDEVFYGIVFYPFLKWLNRRRYFNLIPKSIRKRLADKYRKSSELSKRVLSAYLEDTLTSLYSTWRVQQSRFELMGYFNPKYSENLHDEREEIEEQLSWVSSFPVSEQISYLTLRDIIAGVQLRDIEYMSQAFGVFVWSPLLDKRILEFMYSLPFQQIAKPDFSKPMLHAAMNDIFPKEIITRKKRGFIIPMQVWLEKDLSFLVKRIITDGLHKSLGIWQHERLLELVSELYKPHSGYIFFKVWNVIVTYIWCRLHIIEKRAIPPDASLEEWLG